MKAIVQDRYGSADVVELRQVRSDGEGVVLGEAARLSGSGEPIGVVQRRGPARASGRPSLAASCDGAGRSWLCSMRSGLLRMPSRRGARCGCRPSHAAGSCRCETSSASPCAHWPPRSARSTRRRRHGTPVGHAGMPGGWVPNANGRDPVCRRRRRGTCRQWDRGAPRRAGRWGWRGFRCCPGWAVADGSLLFGAGCPVLPDVRWCRGYCQVMGGGVSGG
jgi:hypothetical protein